MVLKCAIHLEDGTPYYSAGGVVSGFIVLSTTWSDKVYGISVKLASKVEVDWDASRLFNPYRTARNEDVSFHSDCQILMNRTDGEQSCLANLVSKRTIMITRGVVHRYPFLLKLPKDLPCSFNGTFGHVSYKLVVFIRKPFREMYIGATKSIQVSPMLDLNDQSVHLQLPVGDERKYFLSRGSGSRSRTPTPTPTPMSTLTSGAGSGSTSTRRSSSSPSTPAMLGESEVVSMRIRLPKTAFVPDQLIHFEVNLDNASHLTLNGVRVLLNSNTYFQIDQSSKVDGRTLNLCTGPSVGPHSRELWVHSFPCPRVLPTGLGTMEPTAIDLQYFIQFEVRISETVQLSSVVKVVIGTVPYLQRNLSASLASYILEEEALDLLMVPPGYTGDISVAVAPPPSYNDFHLRSIRLHPQPSPCCREECVETPPPTYEEALSKSLSLLRAHTTSPTPSTRPFESTSMPMQIPTPTPVTTISTNANSNQNHHIDRGECHCVCVK